MSVILLNLLYRLHVARSDTRHDYLSYKATAQKASKDLSKATEEQRKKSECGRREDLKIVTNWHKGRKKSLQFLL